MIRQFIITPLNVVLLVALAGVTSAAFLLVPDGAVVPIHWGPTGEADGFADRNLAYLMVPGLALALMALFALILRLGSQEQLAAARYPLETALSGLLALLLVIDLGMLSIGVGRPVDMTQLITAAMGVFLVVMGNITPKAQPNRYAGIRLPWIMDDAVLWQKTHRLVGLQHVLSGALLVVIAFLPAPAPVRFAALLLAVFVPIIVGAWWSHGQARRKRAA